MSERHFVKDVGIKNSVIIALVVFAIFALLRVFNVTGWSWIAITAPLWGNISYYLITGLFHSLFTTVKADDNWVYIAPVGIANVALIFTILQLTNVFTWRWGVVLIPLYVAIPIAVLCVIAYRLKCKQQKSS